MDPLKPYSFKHCHTSVNGMQYHYIDQSPSESNTKPPIVLVHGFPDLWYGWRYQIPLLVNAGHRVIVPSCPGYSETDAPRPFGYYTAKKIATDLIALLKSLDITRAVFIGHDWGSYMVQRVALWFPEHVIAVAIICVPFIRPSPTFSSLEKMVEKYPNYAYQLWMASAEAENELSSKENIERFLKGVYRIKGDETIHFNNSVGLLQGMGNPNLGKLWESNEVWEYYLQEFNRKGNMSGPLTYYKTRGLNYRDELEIVDTARIKCPAMFIGAKLDMAVPPSAWQGQEKWVTQLEKYEIERGHWCLVEQGGKEVNGILLEWVGKVSKAAKL